jgi:hypothetical protein
MPQTRRARQAGSAAFDRLRASIEAAETALKELQGEVSRDSRDLLKDVAKTLRTTRRSLTRSRGRIVKDLEQIQQALVKGKSPRPAAKRPAAKRATAKRATAKRASAKGATAKRPAAKAQRATGAGARSSKAAK